MFKVMKIFRSDKLRELCVSKKWYTLGDNDHYSAMLRSADLIKKETEIKALSRLGEDIVDHTDWDGHLYECNPREDKVAYVMSIIIEKCFDVYVTVSNRREVW